MGEYNQILFTFGGTTDQTIRRIYMLDGSNDADSSNYVPF